jgi:hypothetical protein
MYPEHLRKEETMDNSAKFVRTKQKLLELFRPRGPQPIYEAPAVEPRQSKFEEEMQEFNEYLDRAGRREAESPAD